MNPVNEFRRKVKAMYPHVKVSVRTVGFGDMARDSAKCVTVEHEENAAQLLQINLWAKEAGLLGDTSIRFYPLTT